MAEAIQRQPAASAGRSSSLRAVAEDEERVGTLAPTSLAVSLKLLLLPATCDIEFWEVEAGRPDTTALGL
ncbi:hypothetical protein RTBOTA2_004754 [Rhodotorula toruloides]|nr:hypothetical protein RTBOTA2_004754 [Rhodotorula toruloides]